MKHLVARTTTMVAAVSLLVAATTRQAEAQKIGVLGGANFESLTDLTGATNSQFFRSHHGYHVGVFVALGTGLVSVRPSLLYLNAGRLFQDAQFLTEDVFDLTYLSMPIDVRVHPIPMVYLLAGPEFQFLLSSANAQADFKDDLSKLVVNGGAGLGFQLGPAFVEGRYLFGLTGVTSDVYSVGPFTVTSTNQVSNAVRVSAGIGF